MRRPRISKESSWKRHENRILDVLAEALLILRSEDSLQRLSQIISSADDKRQIEDKINEQLYFCLNQANRQLRRSKRGVETGVWYETRNQPVPDDTLPTTRQHKRPDFSWGYFDPVVLDEREGNRIFAIECKRLGEPTSKSWQLNKKYVQNGILRFVKSEYAYGNDEASAAMIAYVENMEFDEILLEVNTEIESCKESISTLLKPKEGWQINEANRLEHTFERPFLISPFHLWHFWLDLRGCYDRNARKRTSAASVATTSIPRARK